MERDEMGSENSLVGIGGINAKNDIKESFEQLKTFKVEDKNGSRSNNSGGGNKKIILIDGESIVKGSFNRCNGVENHNKKADTTGAAVSSNSLVGIGVIIGKNNIDGSFNQLGTFKVEGTNGSGSNNSPVGIGVINGEKTFKEENSMTGSFKQSETRNVKYKRLEYKNKKGSGSKNSLVGIGVINGGNTIDNSFKQLETFNQPE